jgi:hypothetical protein
MVALVLVNFFLQGILSTGVTHHTSRCGPVRQKFCHKPWVTQIFPGPPSMLRSPLSLKQA